MALTLPPPPIGEPPGSLAWQQWYLALTALYSETGAIPWAVIDTAGSNLTDIATRTHVSLQSLQGGTAAEYYHLTSAQHGLAEKVLVTKLRPTDEDGTAQTVTGFYGGSGAPNNANGSNGDFYFRSDGTAAGNTVIYHKEAGAWVALVTT